MAARVAAIRRFLADSRQELHEVHRSQTPDRSRRNLPLLGHRVGRHRAAGNAWKVRLLKSLSRRWEEICIDAYGWCLRIVSHRRNHGVSSLKIRENSGHSMIWGHHPASESGHYSSIFLGLQ